MFKYKRIVVIGCCASGKSTFSRKLSQVTGIPCIHLDRLYWKSGWIEEDREVFKDKQQAVVNTDSWIIDGNYKNTLEIRLARAELVIWYRLSRYDCITGYLKRLAKGMFINSSRPDMAEGCKEKPDFEFIKYIWNFNKIQEKQTAEILAGYPNVKIITFRSRKTADRFIERIEKSNIR